MLSTESLHFSFTQCVEGFLQFNAEINELNNHAELTWVVLYFDLLDVLLFENGV